MNRTNAYLLIGLIGLLVVGSLAVALYSGGALKSIDIIPSASPLGLYTCNNQSSPCTPVSATIQVRGTLESANHTQVVNSSCTTSQQTFVYQVYTAYTASIAFVETGAGAAGLVAPQGLTLSQYGGGYTQSINGALNYTYLGIQGGSGTYQASGYICYVNVPLSVSYPKIDFIDLSFFQVANGQYVPIPGTARVQLASNPVPTFVGIGLKPLQQSSYQSSPTIMPTASAGGQQQQPLSTIYQQPFTQPAQQAQAQTSILSDIQAWISSFISWLANNL